MRSHASRLPLVVVLFLSACLPAAAADLDKPPESHRLVLPNGFEAILIPNRAAPLATSVVIVRVGSAHETPEVSGISHMLEHLLFDGTATRTREQIEAEQARHGLINNAHTDVGHTDYFVMAPREQFHLALEIQADMLFGSILSAEAIERERGIVSNEIAKDDAQETAAISALMGARLFAESAPGLPVAGTAASIAAMPEGAIRDWYAAWYRPNNMTAIVMGDFDPAEVEPLVRYAFGRAAPGPLFPPTDVAIAPESLGRTHAVRTQGSGRLIWMAAPAPAVGEETYATAWALASLLDEGLADAANAALAAAGEPGRFLEVSTSLGDHGRVGTLQLQGRLDGALPWAKAESALRSALTGRLAGESWTVDALRHLVLASRASEARLWEKPHYFGLDRAAPVAAAGWEYARNFGRHLAWVAPEDLRKLARPLTDPSRWATFLAGSDAPAEAPAIARPTPLPASESSKPAKPTRDSKDTVSAWGPPKLTPPGPLGPAPRSAAPIAARLVLPNGLTVSLEVSDDSRVFAAHVLVRGRSLSEPEGRAGIAEMLHLAAGDGTGPHPGEALRSALSAIGGSLKVADDPQLPYDDIYLSRDYTYMRLEALDESAQEALGLLREILEEPALPTADDDPALGQLRERLLSRTRSTAGSPRDQARALLASGLWGPGSPFAAPLFGTPESVAAITAQDLRQFHRRYFHPRNLLVGINTSVRAERLLPVLEKLLGRWGTDWPAPPPMPPRPYPMAASAPSGPMRAELSSPQAYLCRARAVDPSADQAAAEALAAVLSRRMNETIRETRGLSYSLGAELSREGGRRILTSWVGTRPSTLASAREGLGEVLASLSSTPPSQAEVDAALGWIRTRALMRGLSRINRAWIRCIAEMEGLKGVPVPPITVPAEKVAALARDLTSGAALSGWVEALAGPPEPPAGAPAP